MTHLTFTGSTIDLPPPGNRLPAWSLTPLEQNGQLEHPDSIVDRYIRRVFLDSGKNVTRTARRLELHRRTLQRILDKNPHPPFPSLPVSS